MKKEYKQKGNFISGSILMIIVSFIYALIKNDQVLIDALAIFIVSGLASVLINLFLYFLGKNNQWINMWFLAFIILCATQAILFVFNSI